MRSTISEVIGSGLCAARTERGWSQRRLAAESGVPQTVISTLERAVHLHPVLDSVARLCTTLDAELIVDIRPARLVGRSDQRDPAHAACVAAVRRILERAAWLTASEVEVTTGRAHGFIDLIAFDPVTLRLLVIEVKTELRDVGGLERQIGWYEREARWAAGRLGWRPRRASGLVVCLASAAVDATIIANRAQLAAAFPVRVRAVRAALAGHAELQGRGLVLIDPLRRGAAGLMSVAADGRRSPAPYRDYAGFMECRRARSRGRSRDSGMRGGR